MTHSFVVYIDESGDEGFKFKTGKSGGSTSWFVLSAVIVRRSNDRNNVTLLDHVRATLGRPARSHLHFRNLKHEQRVPFVSAISAHKLHTVTVLMHKPSLTSPDVFDEKYRLYFYCARFLLERVSWFCRDRRIANESGDGSARVVFSNRRNLSYSLLRDYLQRLKCQVDREDIRIDWSVLKPDQIEAQTHHRVAGLQIADAVASSMFYAAEINAYGFLESRYAEILAPIAYRHGKQCMGYGLKLFPGEMQRSLLRDDRYRWIRDRFL